MRHARGPALDTVESVLGELRLIDGITERSRGIFYRGSKAFLHFHEDPAGMFADLRSGDGFDRLPVNNAPQEKKLLAAVRQRLR